MRERISMALQVTTVVLLGAILLRLADDGATAASPAEASVDTGRMERLLERLIVLGEHNGNQLYLICLSGDSRAGYYGPECEAVRSEYIP